MLRRVALRALIVLITTQTSITLPLTARVAVQEYSNRVRVELHLGLPLPKPHERVALAALLDVRWCAHERCETLLQLWAPTLAADRTIAHLDSTQSNEDAMDSSAVATWNVPWLSAPYASNRTSGFIAIALVSIYNEDMSRLALAEALLPLHASADRPRFQASMGLRYDETRVWLSTSFVIANQLSTDRSLTILCSTCDTDDDIAQSLNRLAASFLRALVHDEKQVEETLEAVVTGILKSRQGRLKRRTDLAHRLGHWQRARCARSADTAPSPGLRLVIGAGPAEMAADDGSSTHAWITSDVNSFDITDAADWAVLSHFFECTHNSAAAVGPIHRLFAEHVFEHLDYNGAHFALAQVAKAFAVQPTTTLPSPVFRIAVPDAWAGGTSGVWNTSSMNSYAADVRDGHRVRYTAWALCALLDAAGLNGRLLEWNYPHSAAESVAAAFSPAGAETREHHGWTSRVHKLDATTEGGGKVLRSMNGGDARGAVSLVVDASLPGTRTEATRGDSCSTLLSAVSETQELGVWGYPGSNPVAGYNIESESIRNATDRADGGRVGFNLASSLRRACENSEAAMRRPECVSWTALAAYTASFMATEKTLSGLALQARASSRGDAPLEDKLEEDTSLKFRSWAEDANIGLASLLRSLGQLSLAARAAQRALIYGIGPLRKRVIGELASILDERRSMAPPCIVASPLMRQVFRPTDSVEVTTNLRMFDETHDEALPWRGHTSSLFKRFSRAALGTCFTLHKYKLGTEIESYPMMQSCTHLAGQSSFIPDSPRVSLTGLESGQYELHVRLWWLPAAIGASRVQRVPFCIRSADDESSECDEDWSNVATNQISDAVQSTVKKKSDKVPIYFVTIVLNGMPFLHHHADAFAETARRLNLPWEWHVVEGVAVGRADKSKPYSFRPLGQGVRSDGCSTDGTFEFLNDIQSNRSLKDHVVVHRNYLGGLRTSQGGLFHRGEASNVSADARCVWTDKLEMFNTAVLSISQPGVLVQVDADELWSPEAIVSAYGLIDRQKHQCLRVHCHFFVGPSLVTINRQGYGHSDAYEWTRVWRFEPGSTFVSHAPPVLMARNTELGLWELLGAGDPLPENVSRVPIQGVRGALSTVAVPCLSPEATSRHGVAFSHYAYALEEQVEFKGRFYGHSSSARDDTSKAWRAMQSSPRPVRVADFLPWVNESERFRETYADEVANSPIARNVPVVPMPTLNNASPTYVNTKAPLSPRRFVAVVDMVICHRYPGGIARVWRGALPHFIRELERSSRDKALIVLLFRDGTPRTVASAIEAYLIREGISVHRSDDDAAAAPSTTCDCGVVPCCADEEAGQSTPTVRVLWGPPHDASHRELDQLALAAICNRVGARAFLSTEYSTPLAEPLGIAGLFGAPPKQVLLVHDFTPERFGWRSAEWAAKAEAMAAATAVVAVSRATAAALPEFYPDAPAAARPGGALTVARNGLDAAFRTCGRRILLAPPPPPSSLGQAEGDDGDDADNHQATEEAAAVELRRVVGLAPGAPYVLVVGPRGGYKNAATLYAALHILNDVKPCVPRDEASQQGVSVLLVGGGGPPRGDEAKRVAELFEARGTVGGGALDGGATLEGAADGAEDEEATNGACPVGHGRFVRAVVHAPRLDDDALREAYRGAALLAYLSLDEGFGLPIAEALACGCPVLASNVAAHREILRCAATATPLGEGKGTTEDEGKAEGKDEGEAGGIGAGWNCSAWRSPSWGGAHPGVALVDPTSPGDVAAALLAFWNAPGGLGVDLGVGLNASSPPGPGQATSEARPERRPSRGYVEPGNLRQEAAARQRLRRRLAAFAQAHFTSWRPLGVALATAALKAAV